MLSSPTLRRSKDAVFLVITAATTLHGYAFHSRKNREVKWVRYKDATRRSTSSASALSDHHVCHLAYHWVRERIRISSKVVNPLKLSANRGIGFTLVKQLAADPSNTIIAACRSPEKADALKAAWHAAEIAMRLVKVGNKNWAVTEAVNKVTAAWDCKAVEGKFL